MLKKFINNRFLVILSIIIVMIGVFFGIKAFIERPQDLGPKLEYIGKEYSSGCVLLLFCFSPSTTTYYFATDMSDEELKNYFAKAKHAQTHTSRYDSYEVIDIQYDLLHKNTGFTLWYFDKNAVHKKKLPYETNKSYIIELHGDSYHNARLAL